MNYIIKKSDLSAVSFASEELKKYLRMLMPRAGEFIITETEPDENIDLLFKVGLFDSLNINRETSYLDDTVYVKADEKGGIISGSNGVSVLTAVYRYLKELGCFWLFPGIDGEIVPVIEKLKKVDIEKTASYRYRGQCNEGAESQRCMMETIDYNAKVGLNSYMLEFDIPTAYYDWYYKHLSNSKREPEPVSRETILQWKRMCETEISKRGLKFHDMGHGWTAEPFGLSSVNIWEKEEQEISDEVRNYLAEVKGERKLYDNIALNTNVCMSNPIVRSKMAKYIADYAEKQNNVDFLHIWLADASNNHCECEKCREKIPSDWYVMLLNDIDAEFTKRNLKSHLVFISYVDTLWAPTTEKIKNESRFTMLFAPITRTYSETFGEDANLNALRDFKINQNKLPNGMGENLGYLKKWQEVWKGDTFVYEYHFWMQQFLDLSGLYHARLLYDDVRGLKKHNLKGIIEDGSQRSFFPTGFSYYVYGETLFDSSVSFEKLKEDYFKNAFGENYKEVLNYLESVNELIDFEYLSGNKGTYNGKGEYQRYINPEYTEKAEKLKEIAAGFRKFAKENRYGRFRAQNVSYNIIAEHTVFVELICDIITEASKGNKEKAIEKFEIWNDSFSEKEVYFETNYDHYSANKVIRRLID